MRANEEDFDGFYAAVFARLVGQLTLVTGNLHEAEEVVQEALARAVPRWARLRASDVPEAWVLHHRRGRPVEEGARQLAIPVGTVKARLARGRRALARRLAEPIQEVPTMDDLLDHLQELADAYAHQANPPGPAAARRRSRARRRATAV